MNAATPPASRGRDLLATGAVADGGSCGECLAGVGGRLAAREHLAIGAAVDARLAVEPVVVDLPSEDESAGWPEYVDTVVRAVGDRSDLVVVGHSLGGFTAPLVCARLPAKLLVLVAGMIPSPGEFFNDWWRNSGYEGTGYEDVFHHDSLSRPRELAEHLHAYAAAIQ